VFWKVVLIEMGVDRKCSEVGERWEHEFCSAADVEERSGCRLFAIDQLSPCLYRTVNHGKQMRRCK
jgi:hypothetical protein